MGWDIDKSHESDDLEREGFEVLPTQNSVASGFPLFSPTLLQGLQLRPGPPPALSLEGCLAC